MANIEPHSEYRTSYLIMTIIPYRAITDTEN